MVVTNQFISVIFPTIPRQRVQPKTTTHRSPTTQGRLGCRRAGGHTIMMALDSAWSTWAFPILLMNRTAFGCFSLLKDRSARSKFCMGREGRHQPCPLDTYQPASSLGWRSCIPSSQVGVVCGVLVLKAGYFWTLNLNANTIYNLGAYLLLLQTFRPWTIDTSPIIFDHLLLLYHSYT